MYTYTYIHISPHAPERPTMAFGPSRCTAPPYLIPRPARPCTAPRDCPCAAVGGVEGGGLLVAVGERGRGRVQKPPPCFVWGGLWGRSLMITYRLSLVDIQSHTHIYQRTYIRTSTPHRPPPPAAAAPTGPCCWCCAAGACGGGSGAGRCRPPMCIYVCIYMYIIYLPPSLPFSSHLTPTNPQSRNAPIPSPPFSFLLLILPPPAPAPRGRQRRWATSGAAPALSCVCICVYYLVLV